LTEEAIYEPIVSIVVPVLNAEATVKDLLDSLVEVEYNRQKLEIIIVDGGSTDKTREIVAEYPVKPISQAKKGLNAARNVGFESSRGEIVLYTDSDCIVPRDWVMDMVRNFEAAEVGCVGGNASRYKDTFLSRYADGSIMPVLRRFRRREVLDKVEPPLRYPAGCNMAFRRAAIERVGGFDEDIRYGFDEDELVERVCRAGYKMVLDPETSVKHQHRASFKEFLEQTFNYGRGGALLLKKRPEDRIAKWNMVTLAFFAAWLVATLLLTFWAITSSAIFLAPLLLITLVPLLLLTLFYVRRAILEKDLAIIVAYPFMDVLRLVAYCFGEIYGLLG